MRKGDTFWGKTHPRESKAHPYVALTDPDTENVIFVVNFTTYETEFGGRVLAEDEVSFPNLLSHKSAVAWSEAKRLQPTQLALAGH